MERLAQLVEQPRVLDGDDGLGGEGRYEFDLLVAEGPDLSTTDRNGTDSLFLPHKRDGQNRAVTLATGHLATIRELLGGR